jgi:hypothetical protein
MDDKQAKDLLTRIESEKQAETSFKGLASMLPTFSNPASPSISGAVQQQQNQQLQADAQRQIIQAAMLGFGGGAALRGVSGLSNLFSDQDHSSHPRRTVEMPVAYPQRRLPDEEEKAAANEHATSPYGLDYYIPGMMLGTGLAAYGGWKGVDAVLNKQRRKQTEDELEQSRQDYEQSLLGAYKRASAEPSIAENLDKAFAACEKQANVVSDTINSVAPNVPGITKGLLAAYSLATLPLGYSIVNNSMRKNSKRALLQKAMQMRARRQAVSQPPALYAIPVPKDETETPE